MLRSKSFAATVGVFWALMVFFVVVLAPFGYEVETYKVVNSLYFGWIPMSVPGAFLGALFGLLDGFVGGYIFAELYNLLALREKSAGRAHI